MLPVQLLKSLIDIKGFDKKSFEKIHASGEQITSIRINPFKKLDTLIPPLGGWGAVPWTEYGYYLPQRPSFTFDPLFHAGCYYVQEASSMFLEQALKQTVDLSKPLKVLDLCAAPGGKSTHIQSLISKDSLLVSNEVIRSRANILKDNIIKWGGENVVVTNNDPKDFTRLENYFDVIVVDAPCSGSGLFRRDPEAIEEWSENNVQLCSLRQQRILADVFPALKKDGVLIYSTCSYSKEEDEDIVNWLKQEFPIFNIPLSIQNDWGIIESNPGYRFWPYKVKGEGFFLACFQKTDGGIEADTRSKYKPVTANKNEMEIIARWVNTTGRIFIKNEETVYAWPSVLADDFGLLMDKLKVIYSCVLTGQLVRDKLVPDHALAMSRITREDLHRYEVNHEQAIHYLQRKELDSASPVPGWNLATYAGMPLGWINVLGNRINNYYPKQLRILKDN